MLKKRIIARLDIKGPNLVKGIHLEGLRVLGDPEVFANHYYKNGADELIYMDVVASLYERNSLREIISKTAKNIFIPLTVGGGIRSLEDIAAVLRAGADKVCINTAAIKKPQFIRDAARKFGSSTIVIAIEAMKQSNGSYLAFTDNGREHTGIDAIFWASQVEELGAGEIIITSVDREGTGLGYDLDLISRVNSTVAIPVIAHGGAGSPNDIINLFKTTDVSAAALASILHYDTISKYREIKNIREGNTEFLSGQKQFNKIKAIDLISLKHEFKKAGIQCRL